MHSSKTTPVPAERRIGRRFGRVVVLGIERRKVGNDRWPSAFAVCICDCGNRPVINLRSLINGRSRSCGCYNRDTASSRGKHYLRRHAIYQTWLGLRNRCNNKQGQDYARYGGRGIYVSARWSEFPRFLADMGERPTPHHTIERIDNDGPYAWWNCRWATRAEQSHNTAMNRWITFRGETLILTDWANRFGVSVTTLHHSIACRGEARAMALAASRARTAS